MRWSRPYGTCVGSVICSDSNGYTISSQDYAANRLILSQLLYPKTAGYEYKQNICWNRIGSPAARTLDFEVSEFLIWISQAVRPACYYEQQAEDDG